MSDDITAAGNLLPMPIRKRPRERRDAAVTFRANIVTRKPPMPPSAPVAPLVEPQPTRPATLSTLPAAPCFKCGARGWCKHRKPEDM